MTENQEKEIFKILNRLVKGVNEIRGDIVEIRGDITEIRGDITEIKAVLKEHSQMLVALDSKTDSIALAAIEDRKRIGRLEEAVFGEIA